MITMQTWMSRPCWSALSSITKADTHGPLELARPLHSNSGPCTLDIPWHNDKRPNAGQAECFHHVSSICICRIGYSGAKTQVKV